MVSKLGKTAIGALAGAGIGEGIAIFYQMKANENSPPDPYVDIIPIPFVVGGALIGGALAYFLWK